MRTPTANRHLCMGEAWLGPQIALTPSVSVCAQIYVFVACLPGSWLCGSWCTCLHTLWNLQMFMQARVWLCMRVWPFHRDQWSSWILILSSGFKHWARSRYSPKSKTLKITVVIFFPFTVDITRFYCGISLIIHYPSCPKGIITLSRQATNILLHMV